MTTEEFRNSKEYMNMKNKIKGYSTGFTFTIPYGKMTEQQSNGMIILMRDCVNEGLLKVISTGISINGDLAEEKYKRV